MAHKVDIRLHRCMPERNLNHAATMLVPCQLPATCTETSMRRVTNMLKSMESYAPIPANTCYVLLLILICLLRSAKLPANYREKLMHFWLP